MGQDAAKSIDDFVTAAGRQSRMIADNLGLIVNAEDSYARFADQIGKTADELTDAEKKQAFLNEMLRQGEIKMRELGDTTLDSAGKVEQATAAWTDAKTALGLTAVSVAETSGALDILSQNAKSITGISGAIQELGFNYKAMWAYNMAGLFKGDEAALQAYYQTMARMGKASIDAAAGHRYLRGEIVRSTAATEDVGHATDEYVESVRGGISDFLAYQKAVESTSEYERKLADTKAALIKRMQESKDAAKAEAEAKRQAQMQVEFDLGRQFSGQVQEMERTAESFAERRAEIEQQHQQRMQDLAKRGQSYAVRLDLEAEQEKLTNLQWRAEQAARQLNELTGKERESSRMAKEYALEQAEAQLAEQRQLLDDYAAGRLVKQGENVDALIAEEQRLHSERLAGLDAQMKKEEEARQAQVKADVGATAISQLGTALAEGKITQEEYAQAVGDVQFSLG